MKVGETKMDLVVNARRNEKMGFSQVCLCWLHFKKPDFSVSSVRKTKLCYLVDKLKKTCNILNKSFPKHID